MDRVLVAGATGYLGQYIVQELLTRKYDTKALVRDPSRFSTEKCVGSQCFQAEATQAGTLEGCCEGIDVVISSLGITRQQDGFSYMDVDYQANLNLLNEAQRNGVKKFIYVSALHADTLRDVKICEAKERFVDALKQSGLEYAVLRPSGFFSDMTEFYNMAKQGRVYLFGDGKLKLNPIHGADLATVCVDAIDSDAREHDVGGPQTLTHTEIAEMAFAAAKKQVKITRIPDWIRRVLLRLVKFLSGNPRLGPVEFFLTVMAVDMTAPEHGKRTLQDYFSSLDS